MNGNSAPAQKRLLIFACHEAWIYQLRVLHFDLDIVIGLRGRPSGWDAKMRPVPPNARLVHLDEVLRENPDYACIIAHNLSDLLDARSISAPRLLMLHETLDGAVLEQGLGVPVPQFRETVAKFVSMTGTHVVAVSSLKGRSWGFEEDIVPFSANPEDYQPWRGDAQSGLRIANQILRRPKILLWDFHQKAFEGIPVALVGHNPGLEAAGPANNWDHLKQIFSRHRFFIHTADPRLEDGYNMATLEAMAAGLPVLGNRHPTSPVEHGISGFLSDDPLELRSFALHLLDDRALAARMGAAACASVKRLFPLYEFGRNLTNSIERAWTRWRQIRQQSHQINSSPNFQRAVSS